MVHTICINWLRYQCDYQYETWLKENVAPDEEKDRTVVLKLNKVVKL